MNLATAAIFMSKNVFLSHDFPA